MGFFTKRLSVPMWAMMLTVLVSLMLGSAGGRQEAKETEVAASGTTTTTTTAPTTTAAPTTTTTAAPTTTTAAGPKSTFSDGVHEVGVDIVAGKYKTDGASTCYWAKLKNDASEDIIDNDVGAGPRTVTIQPGIKFESVRCGTWTKVG